MRCIINTSLTSESFLHWNNRLDLINSKKAVSSLSIICEKNYLWNLSSSPNWNLHESTPRGIRHYGNFKRSDAPFPAINFNGSLLVFETRKGNLCFNSPRLFRIRKPTMRCRFQLKAFVRRWGKSIHLRFVHYSRGGPRSWSWK